MTCKKCGAKLDDNTLFCEECGTKVETTAEETSRPDILPPPAKPKKPINKKRIIQISCAVLIVVALAITVVVCVKKAKTINVEDYIKLSLDSDTFYDGYADGYVTIDISKIAEDRLGKSNDDKSGSKKSNIDLSSLDSLDDLDDAFKTYDLNDITEYCHLHSVINGKETKINSEDYSTSLYNLSKNDVIKVNISWSDSEEAIEEIEKAEDALGVHFSRDDATVEIKVADVISKENITVKTAAAIDIFDSFKECFGFSGLRDGEISFDITDKTKVLGKYLIDIQGSQIHIYNYDGTPDKAITYMKNHGYDASTSFNCETNANSTSVLSVGDTVDVYIEDTIFEDIGLVLTNTSKTFDVTKQEGLTLSQGKSDKNNLKKFLTQSVKNDSEALFSSSDKMKSINSIYLYNAKNDSTEYANVVVVIVKNNDKTYTPYYAYNVVKGNGYTKTYFEEKTDEDSAKLVLKQVKDNLKNDYKMIGKIA